MTPTNVDYAALRRKFPVKDSQRKKKAAAIKAIQREYAAKRLELGGGAPTLKKGVVFYAVVIIGLAMLGSLVLSVCGKGGRAVLPRAQMQARSSIDSVAVAIGRFRYHLGRYPTDAEGLAALAEITPNKKGWNGPYINHVVKDPWGNDYVYFCNGEGECPTLYSKGADGLAGTTDDVLPDRALFDEPFRDTSWTKGWMPYYLRGYVLAQDKRAKASIEAQVREVLKAEEGPTKGEFLLSGEWKDGERALELPKGAAGSYVALRFEGVSSPFEVFLNTEKVGATDGKRAFFEVDISAKVKFGERNALSISGDPSIGPKSKLVIEDYEDRALWGSVRVAVSDVSNERAKVVVSFKTPVSSNVIVNEQEVERPVFWDVSNPRLYETKVCAKSYRYGIRTVELVDGALRLNGRPVALKCVDYGVFKRPLVSSLGCGAMRRVMGIVKDMGANSVRVVKGCPSAEFLDLCDEKGVLVLDEAGTCSSMRPDRNHPSVVSVPSGSELRREDAEAFLAESLVPTEGFWSCRARWNDRVETVRLFPHWSWDGKEGEKVSVVCRTSGDEAELFVNGESAGRTRKLAWEVPYEPGEVKVIAFRNGHPLGEDVMKSAFKPASICLLSDRKDLSDGGLAFVRAEIRDGYDTCVPNAKFNVKYTLEGPGEIAADLGSLVVIRRTGGSGQPLKLTASADSLRNAYLTLPRSVE